MILAERDCVPHFEQQAGKLSQSIHQDLFYEPETAKQRHGG